MAHGDVVASVRGVTKTYGEGAAEVRALRGIDLDLHAGGIVVVLGPSGSGKTTLLNILGGIEAASSGTVTLGGKDLSGRTAEELATVRRDNVAFIFQYYNLIQTLTAQENVRIIAELTGRSGGDGFDEQVAEALSGVGIADRADAFPAQMSGGQQQRVAIARALVTGPRLLLCDEPTGALDLATGRQVLSLLQREAQGSERCVVIVTHNSGIAVMADRVIRVHDGVIAGVTAQDARPADEVVW